MIGLQKELERLLNEHREKLLSDLVVEKLGQHGVRLSARQLKSLEKQLRTEGGEFVHQPWKFWERRHIALEFTDADVEDLKRKAEEIEKALPDVVAGMTDGLAVEMLGKLKRDWSRGWQQEQRQLDGFRKRLYGRWKKPLDLLRMLFAICRELGADVNQVLTHAPEFANRRHLVDVMRRSHARACQITSEILALLEGGFADGAMARWRTLHEVAVIASFVAEHGEDLAERYVFHQAVESKRAADEYQRCAPRLGFAPLETSEINAIHAECDKVLLRYGKDFKGDYGWAAHQLGIGIPNFSQIERSVKSDHMRSHYRLASQNVHANPRGVFYKLGLMPETPLLLAGPSNSGLTEPGQGAALSLARVTADFATLNPSLDHNVVLRMVTLLLDEIGPAFGEAQKRIDDDENALRAAEKSTARRRGAAPGKASVDSPRR